MNDQEYQASGSQSLPILRFDKLETMLEELVADGKGKTDGASPVVRLTSYFTRKAMVHSVTNHETKLATTAMVGGEIYFWASRVGWYQMMYDRPFSEEPHTRLTAIRLVEWALTHLA